MVEQPKSIVDVPLRSVWRHHQGNQYVVVGKGIKKGRKATKNVIIYKSFPQDGPIYVRTFDYWAEVLEGGVPRFKFEYPLSDVLEWCTCRKSRT